jgi:plastocyanin
MKRYLLLPAALLIVIAAFAAISLGASKPTANAAATSVSVSAKEFRFTLNRTRAPHGSVAFRLTNRGRLPHDFRINGRKTRVISRGRSATLTVTLRRGSYRYICTVSGHADQGMRGTFRVS